MEAVKACGADWILAPSPAELHPDHQVVGLAAAEAVRRLQGERVLAFYEVSSPLQPNALIDISSVEDVKHRAMRCFVSQETVQSYSERIQGLNLFRGYSLGPRCRAAEAFHCVRAQDLVYGLRSVPRCWQDRRAASLAAMDPQEVPLVSVIVRSMDRPSLPEALQSIADQTYPNIQVVVVNAKGGRHSPVPVRQPHWDVVLVDDTEPLGRSRAANVGLQHAQGRWILFLDDDDLLLPDHVDKLAQALRDDPSYLAAYGGVRVIDRNGVPLFDYDRPYRFERLLASNFIPNMAVLFDRMLVEERGCFFDESLPVLEDWDFWLQVARHTEFLHVPGISAIYRYGLGQSGLSQGRQESLYRRHREALMEKWFRRLGLEALDHALEVLSRETDQTRVELEGVRQKLEETLKERTAAEARYEEALAHLAQERREKLEREAIIGNLESLAESVRRELESVRQGYEELEARLRVMESSRVWKATYPVRYCIARLRKAFGFF